MSSELKGKVAVVTGGSRGIGRAISLEFARRGARVVINYVRNEEAARETSEAVRALGTEVLILRGNIGDPKTIEELLEQAASKFGGIDILVHNAALGSFKPIHQLKLNHWDLTLDVNTKAFFLLAQKVLPFMEKKGGSILAISSLGARRYIPDYGAIGISKAAVEALVKYFAAEYAPKGIRVNAVSGGLIETEAITMFPRYEELKKEVLLRTPAGRLGKPEDIAGVVAFLTSDAARWIYGQTVIADGGFSLI